MFTNKKRLTLAIASSLALFASSNVLAAPVELQLDYEIPLQQHQVAFVPFAGDNAISPVVLNDLSKTELKPTSQNLPQQPHSSAELAGTLPVWQQTAIPYLVVGGTKSNKGKVITDYEVIDLKTGRTLGGRQTLSADNDRTSLRYAGHVIADKIYELITGNEGDFSGRIAYIEETGSEKDKISQLKVIDADGENAMALTPPIRGSIFSPAWSPDARMIAYAVQKPNEYSLIYIQSASGGAPRLLTPFKGSNLNPTFSPDGSSILFSGSHEGTPDIYRISVSGGTPQKIVGTPYADVQPSYAPDGRSFLYVSDPGGNNKTQIFRYDFASGKSTPVTRGGYVASPQYNKDGTQIAFLSGRSAAIMNNSGAIVTNLGSTGIDEAPSFSPNGKRVVYASKQGGKGILTIKSLVGGEAFGKSANGIIRSPVWSPKPQ